MTLPGVGAIRFSLSRGLPPYATPIQSRAAWRAMPRRVPRGPNWTLSIHGMPESWKVSTLFTEHSVELVFSP